MNTRQSSPVVIIEIITLKLNDKGNERLLLNTLEITNPTTEQFFFRYDQLKDTDLSIKRPLNRSPYISVKKLAQAKSETITEVLRLAREQQIPTYYFSAQDQPLPAIFFDSPLNISHTVEGCRYFEIKNRSLANLVEYFTNNPAIPGPVPHDVLFAAKTVRHNARGPRRTTDIKNEAREQAAFKVIAETKNARRLMIGNKLSASALVKEVLKRFPELGVSEGTLQKFFSNEHLREALTERLKNQTK